MLKTYTLKLSSGTAYKLYDGATLVTDADLGTLFGAAGSAYFVFDFNSGTPSDLTAVSITNSSDTEVMGITGLAAGTVKENYNFKGAWDGATTTFTSFAQLTGQAMDEAELSFLMGKIKTAGPTVVQTAGTSSTDVMSQDAASKLVFKDPSDKGAIKIGDNITFPTTGVNGVAIGYQTQCSSENGVAIGYQAKNGGSSPLGIAIGKGANTGTNNHYSIAIGGNASVPTNRYFRGCVALGAYSGPGARGNGFVDISALGAPSHALASTSYNSSGYRILTGLYPGQQEHDAATYGQLSTAILNGGTTAPTTATVGAVGTLYSYVDTTGTPTPHLMVCTAVTDVSGTTEYTWVDLMGSVSASLQTLISGSGATGA